MQRAIGMSAGSLYKTFLWEGAYYGIIASVIGSVLGYVCTIFIEAATSDTIQLVAIPVMPILEATLLAVGACLLSQQLRDLEECGMIHREVIPEKPPKTLYSLTAFGNYRKRAEA